jgi:hypothetical protein
LSDKTDDDLAVVIEETREGVVRSARKMQQLLKKMEQNLDGLASDPKDPRRLQQAMTAYGIAIDKVPILLRTLRALEAEAVDDIEVGWNIVVREE